MSQSVIEKLLLEQSDIESDIADLTTKTDDILDSLKDNVGRVGYMRQLTAELLDYLITLDGELDGQVEIPKSNELLSKMLGRRERKKYYLSKFRL